LGTVFRKIAVHQHTMPKCCFLQSLDSIMYVVNSCILYAFKYLRPIQGLVQVVELVILSKANTWSK